MRRSSLSLSACAALAALLVASLPLAATPPPTAAEPVTETLHGVELTDPYRWLEGSAAPEVEEDPELDARVESWTEAQNAYTRGVLDNLAAPRPAPAGRSAAFHQAGPAATAWRSGCASSSPWARWARRR